MAREGVETKKSRGWGEGTLKNSRCSEQCVRLGAVEMGMG